MTARAASIGFFMLDTSATAPSEAAKKEKQVTEFPEAGKKTTAEGSTLFGCLFFASLKPRTSIRAGPEASKKGIKARWQAYPETLPLQKLIPEEAA
jgi:hypothetical protein